MTSAPGTREPVDPVGGDIMPSAGYLLREVGELEQIAADAVGYARSLGIEHSAVAVIESAGVTMKVRNGRSTVATRDGGTKLNISLYHHGGQGASATAMLTPHSLRLAVDRAFDIAKRAEPNTDFRPADERWLGRDAPRVETFAPSGLSPANLRDSAVEIEDEASAAKEVRSGIARVLEATATSNDVQLAMAISPDFARSGRSSLQSRSCRVLATGDAGMAQGGWSTIDRRTDHLLGASSLAATAVARAVRKLGGRPAESGTSPVLFDATVGANLVGALCGALSGEGQYRSTTFLPEALGQCILADHISLVEDPFEPFGLQSGGCDGEGIAATQRPVVQRGCVQGYFMNSYAARKLNMAPTGNASGVWNLALSSSATQPTDDLPTMLRRLDRGLWITEFLGGQTDGVTGSFSMAVAGFWIEHGLPVYPVRDTTISGDLRIMLLEIAAIGADVYRSGAIRTGSILIDAMLIVGR